MQVLEIDKRVEISVLEFMGTYKCIEILQNIDAFRNIFNEIIK